jgi:hypothetical protein
MAALNQEQIINGFQALQRLCKISICPPDETTDFDQLFSVSTGMDGGTDSAERFVIEFGSSNPTISVSVNQHIKIDDTIAYMKGIPVKSHINGIITEVTDKYIIGTYETDYNEILSSLGLSAEMTEEDIKNRFGLQ